MPNFNEIADQRVGDVERPALMPIGSYVWAVIKVPSRDTISDGRFEVVDFSCKCVAPGEDADPDAIEEFGDVTNVNMRHRFMFNTEDKNAFDRSLFNLKRFLEEHLQIDGASDMSINEALNAAVNCQFLGEVGWRPDRNDPEIQYAEIRRTAPVA